ncbi:glycosyltransferase involved in cell wall biosynthesis [Wenyingzhuangia heitensis]|uniref:Glycosyltransferase involved in cell wall biosynthesis n=1 Tax=Wenyingzhuangia heitensis TaxID=1487859 RepID=A0ABX0UCA3_9FLAO|nr:glycosyltransferase family 4 protein [Wenyingzhuangia heitensis]NIJ45445.1 glycosyltransferase involved in cell wall biosynthesis [Wenyingzhuangia heitensis]
MRILYLGNDLSKASKYHSAYATLKINLRKEGYTVFTASTQKKQLLRLLDMIYYILKYRHKVDYVLIDTFSTNAFYFAFICSQISRLFRLKYIPILHGGNLPSRLDRSFLLSNLIFKNSEYNVSPSNYLKYEFEKRNFKVLLIPNTIDINEYPFKERKKIEPKILYVRAFASIYNPLMAIKVFKKVFRIYPNAKLCMVGPNRDGILSEVLKEIELNNLQNNVKITGVLPKEDWHSLSKDYDIFINTTNVDNTPVSLIETMALGLPIVSTNVGGVPYLVSDKIDGLLVDKNDVNQMYTHIIDLLENEDLTNQLSKKGREKAVLLDWENVKEKWIKILK